MAQDAGACRLDFAEVVGTYSGLTKTSTALPRLSSKRTIL
ncbi:branched-chain amino acid permease [Neisseria meningitidis]|nr:branched-chain amino acid permease [Neisseria meningitidis]